MRSTLFYIPNQIGPIPFLKPEGWDYGIGLLLAVVLLCGGIMLYSKYRRQGTSGDFFGSLAMLALVCLAIVFVMPYIIDEGRGLPIRGYGTMLLVAVVSGVALAMWRARQVGANPEIILSMMFFIFVGGLVGGRGLYVIQYWKDFKPRFICSGRDAPPGQQQYCGTALREERDGRHYCPRCDEYRTNSQLKEREPLASSVGRIVNVTTGGLVVFGALLGAAVPFGIYVWRHRLPVLALSDILVASLLLGQGLGRVGCLLNGCCYGGVCELPNLPTVLFPHGSPAHHRQVEEGKAFLHGLKLVSEDEREGNPKPSVFVGAVEPGSPAERAGMRSGQRIVAIHSETDSRRNTNSAEMITNPTKNKLHELLFFVDGQLSRDRIVLDVATEEKAVVSKTWTVMPAESSNSLPVHPTQIYDAVNAFLMALFAWFYFPFRRRDGEVFAVMLMIHPISRFLMEWVRTDEAKEYLQWVPWVNGMTISQVISIGLLLSAIPFWYFVLRQPRDGKLTPSAWAAYNARWAEAGASA